MYSASLHHMGISAIEKHYYYSVWSCFILSFHPALILCISFCFLSSFCLSFPHSMPLSGPSQSASIHFNFLFCPFSRLHKTQDSLLYFSNERTLFCGQYKIIKIKKQYLHSQSQTNIPHIHAGSGGGDKVTQFSQL